MSFSMNACQRNERLDTLFAMLQKTTEQSVIAGIESEIWKIWTYVSDPEIDGMMDRGLSEMSIQDYEASIRTYSVMSIRWPYHAEVWNKRATCYYLRGHFKCSLDDIERTLTLEPRHFGALAGKSAILLEIKDIKGAIKAMENMLQLAPNKRKLRANVEALYKTL